MNRHALIAAVTLPILLLGQLLAAPARAADTVVYYHTDALHSVAVVTNASGAVIERAHYAPYGQVLDRPLRDGPGYTGHQEDATTGLVYMQQRYYDPESGRFLSADPVQADGNGGNFNRYWYANDNPYRYTDPDGRCPEYGCGPMVQAFAAHPVSDQTALAAASALPVVGDAVNIGVAIKDPSFSNIAIAAVGLVVPEAGALLRVGKVAKAARLAENVKQGAAAETKVAGQIGDKVAGTHITLEASTGQRSVADIVTTDKGVVEVKSGPGARLSPGQKAIQSDINAGRSVTPRGQNAAKAGLEPGKPVQMKCYDVKHC